MKSNVTKKVFKVVRKIMLSFFVVLLFFVLPLFSPYNEDLSVMYGVFVGKKSEFQGMLEIWNVDTFESGTASKSSFLSYASKEFQKNHKGLYFMIRNVSKQELVNLLEIGEKPDLISCSYGVAESVKAELKPFSKNVSLQKDFLEAGKLEGKQFGLAWCYGIYFLISTPEKLEQAGVDDVEKFDIINKALTLGFEKKLKKETKKVYSLSVGFGDFLLPQMALRSYNNIEEPAKGDLCVNQERSAQSQYLAYSRFVSGESVMLLGSQRDIFRMEQRVNQGKIQSVISTPLCEFTDLVQFMFLCETGNSIKEKIAEEFSYFLLSKQIQKKISRIGMFSPVISPKEMYKQGVICDILPEKFSVNIKNDVFLTETEIAGLREKFKLF